MPLTHFDIQNALPRGKPYKLADGGGLFLLIQPNGSKLWRLKYRHLGTERLLSFGPYPIVSLADARTKRDEAKKLMSDGVDPAVRKKLDRIAAETAARNTFGLIVEEFIANLESNDAAPATLAKNKWLLEDLAKPLANRPIAEITAAEILDLLKRIEKSGRRETARRLRGVMGAVFRLAVVTLRAPGDPTHALQGALLRPNTKSRAAITDERKFGALLRAIDDYDGWTSIRAALQFSALTFARPGEVRGARRSEILLDKATWRIPGERTKTRRPHDVPLSRQALVLLRDVWPISDGGDLLFPSTQSLTKMLSENAFNAALRRMGFGSEEMTAHGFRATASTILNEREFNPDVIEAALAHQHENEIRRVYNRAAYWKERVAMMQAWADMLDEFRVLPPLPLAPHQNSQREK
jgi:integrase